MEFFAFKYIEYTLNAFGNRVDWLFARVAFKMGPKRMLRSPSSGATCFYYVAREKLVRSSVCSITLGRISGGLGRNSVCVMRRFNAAQSLLDCAPKSGGARVHQNTTIIQMSTDYLKQSTMVTINQRVFSSRSSRQKFGSV